MPERNYVAEMNALCREALAASDLPVPVVAEELARKVDPDLLAGWMQERVVDIIRQHLLQLGHVDRTTARRSAGPRAFAAAAEAFAAGEETAFGSRFTAWHRVDDKGTRRQVGDMTGEDHLFVAENYQQESTYTGLLARVHRRIGRKLGDRKTSEVYSEQEYAALFGKRAGSTSAA